MLCRKVKNVRGNRERSQFKTDIKIVPWKKGFRLPRSLTTGGRTRGRRVKSEGVLRRGIEERWVMDISGCPTGLRCAAEVLVRTPRKDEKICQLKERSFPVNKGKRRGGLGTKWSKQRLPGFH